MNSSTTDRVNDQNLVTETFFRFLRERRLEQLAEVFAAVVGANQQRKVNF
jgi:hypothetical protein